MRSSFLLWPHVLSPEEIRSKDLAALLTVHSVEEDGEVNSRSEHELWNKDEKGGGSDRQGPGRAVSGC